MANEHILVIDDQPDIRTLVQEILEDEGYSVETAENGETARIAQRSRRHDLILLDIWMPDIDGISLLKEWKESGSQLPPVIMMSGHGTVETAVEATRLGAYDFIEKPLSLAKLLLTVERALETAKLQRENVGLKQKVQPLMEPLGKSDAIENLRQLLQKVGEHDTWVLLQGESGSGKHLAAHYIHAHSGRANGPFIDVGVAAIAAENSAVELFGSEDNGNIYIGRLEQAHGGTLYLDDIADMDLATQGRLLSALETASFMRIGGNQVIDIDVRIIAATQQNLEEAVKRGDFREDLYHQLNVVPITIPALREHCEDIPELTNYFIDYYVANEKLSYRNFTVASQNLLRNHAWSGNIRELKNLIQRLLIMGGGTDIEPEEVQAALGHSSNEPEVGGMPGVFDLPLREAREQFEKAYLEHQLRETDGSVGKVAKLAGMERTHLYRKMRALGIDPKQLSGTNK